MSDEKEVLISNGDRVLGAVVAGLLAGVVILVLLLIGSALIVGGLPDPSVMAVMPLVGLPACCLAWSYAVIIARWLDASAIRNP